MTIGKPPAIPADGGLRIRYGRATMHLTNRIVFFFNAFNFNCTIVVRIKKYNTLLIIAPGTRNLNPYTIASLKLNSTWHLRGEESFKKACIMHLI